MNASQQGVMVLIIKWASTGGWLPGSGVAARAGALRPGRMAGTMIKAGLIVPMLLCLGCCGAVFAQADLACEDNPFLRNLPGGCEQFAPSRTRQIGDREILIVARQGATPGLDIWEAHPGDSERPEQAELQRIPRVDLLRLRDDLLVASFHLRFAPGRSELSAPGEALIEEYLDLIVEPDQRLHSLEVIGHTDIVPTRPGRRYDEINGQEAGWCQSAESVYDSRPVASDSNECIGLLRMDAFLAVVSRHAGSLLRDDSVASRYSPNFFLDEVDALLDGQLYSSLGLANRVADFKVGLEIAGYDHANVLEIRERRHSSSVVGHGFSEAEMDRLEPFRAIVAIARFE